jgi:hypothetical protein
MLAGVAKLRALDDDAIVAIAHEDTVNQGITRAQQINSVREEFGIATLGDQDFDAYHQNLPTGKARLNASR